MGLLLLSIRPQVCHLWIVHSFVALFAGPMWFRELGFVPPALQLLGLLLLFSGILSAFGVGPWGRYYSKIVVSDNEAYLRSLEVKQPWQQ